MGPLYSMLTVGETLTPIRCGIREAMQSLTICKWELIAVIYMKVGLGNKSYESMPESTSISECTAVDI